MMFAELVRGTDLTVFPIVGFLVFFLISIVAYVWVFAPSRQRYWKRMAVIPFDENDMGSQELAEAQGRLK